MEENSEDSSKINKKIVKKRPDSLRMDSTEASESNNIKKLLNLKGSISSTNFKTDLENTESINVCKTSEPNQQKALKSLYNQMVEDTKDKLCIDEDSCGKLKLTPELEYDFTSDDLTDLGEIGRGGFGTVNKMVHKESKVEMAVKRIRSTVDKDGQKKLLMDLKVVMKSNNCPYIVRFYGVLFKEGDCWICMELMDISLDKFYKYIYDELNEQIPEQIIRMITYCTVKALNYLKEQMSIIHRDVKPSNILLDINGSIKLCDFGISGQLVDSIARTRDAGCRPYMAPERIDPQRARRGYDVRSDVWSLGITLYEISTGKFPYPKWQSVFEQLHQVVNGDPPKLQSNSTYSNNLIDFVNTCLIKDESQRPKYNKLLKHQFILELENSNNNNLNCDMARYCSKILLSMRERGITPFTTNVQQIQ